MDKTPFNLAFGIEAIILLEIGLPSLQVKNFNKDDNSEQLRANLDLLEELWERVVVKIVVYR